MKKRIWAEEKDIDEEGVTESFEGNIEKDDSDPVLSFKNTEGLNNWEKGLLIKIRDILEKHLYKEFQGF